ncbi:MAG TPA: tripartite tricarboxylate transporter substrate binding protein, partial [Sulfitobacter pontiacus]|nr:tripartite tricarboxylate transporter substrate binding protein [Sulfitobacter pontiacus]
MTFRSGLAALFTAASLIAAPATADTYPEREVEFIVPWS